MNKQQLGSWTVKQPMEIARSHCPVSVYKDKIFVFGGGGPEFLSLNSVIFFDPKTNSWEKGKEMPTLHSGAVAITVNDKIYVIGGGFRQDNGTFKFLPTVEIYYPEKDIWETGPDMLMPHDYPSVAFLDGHIYIMGGHHPDATTGGPKTDPGFDFCERLNLSKGSWEQIASLNTPRFALSADIVDGNIITSGGVAFSKSGFNNYEVIETYDIIANKWNVHDNFSLPWAAAGHGTCVVNGHLFSLGGYSGDFIEAKAAFFNKTEKNWIEIAPIPQPIAAMGIAIMEKNIYLIGGWGTDGKTPVNSVFEFDTDSIVK